MADWLAVIVLEKVPYVTLWNRTFRSMAELTIVIKETQVSLKKIAAFSALVSQSGSGILDSFVVSGHDGMPTYQYLGLVFSKIIKFGQSRIEFSAR